MVSLDQSTMNNRKNGFQYGGSLPLMHGYHHAPLPFSSYHFHHQPPLLPLPLPLGKAPSIKLAPAGKGGGSAKKRRNGRKETRSMKMETISHHHYDNDQSSKSSKANNIVKPLILGTVYSPPPSSLPLPRFSLMRAKTPSNCSSSSSSSSSCIVEAIGGGKETVTTDDLRRIFGL